ncbi:hypothetical protein L1049_012833 [Liquidambar formosana]|uniref:Transmembrane protein n=1 Tax=Liquidambar formosana TaxID=63359 RepID=A0AAP0RJ89_LIQFO
MQRPTSAARAPEEHCIINITQQPQAKHSPRLRRTDDTSDLPIYELPRSNFGRRENSRSRLLEKWVHAVPVIVFLSLFILWWFSYPAVSLVIKDGRITAIHRIEIPLLFNDTHVDLTILASAAPPHASVPQKMTVNNETEAQPVSIIG